MIQPISSSEFLAIDYPPKVVVDVPVKLYPSSIHKVMFTQSSINDPIITTEGGFQIAQITVQPYSTQYNAQQLLDGFEIGPNKFLEFKVEAKGTNLKYQWKQNGVVIPNGTSSILRIVTLNNYSSTMNSVNYITVEVSNSRSTVVSGQISLGTTNDQFGPTLVGSLIQSPASFIANMGDTISVGNSGTFTTEYTPNATYTKEIGFSYGSTSSYYPNVTTETKSFTVPALVSSGNNVDASVYASMFVGSSSWDYGNTYNWTFNINKYPVTNTFNTVKNAGIALLDSIFATNPVTSNLTTSTKLWIYSSISSLPDNPVATFNTNFWAYSRRDVLNFSGVSFVPPGDVARNGDQVNGTLITPQHIITATHFKPNEGSTIHFYRHNDGVGVPAVVSTQRNLAGTDFTICKLLNPVTDPNIKIYPIVSDYSHHWYKDPHLPIFTFSGKDLSDDKSKDYALGIFRTQTNNSLTNEIDFTCQLQSLNYFKSSYPNYSVGSTGKVGDSANPLFVYTPAGLSLITTLYSAVGGPAIYGSTVSAYIDTSLALSSFNPNGYTVTRTSLGLPRIT